MDTYKIAIDTFLAETSECKASGCAVFTGADITFQDIQLHTHRNKSELHFHSRTHYAFHPPCQHPEHRKAGIAGYPDHRV